MSEPLLNLQGTISAVKWMSDGRIHWYHVIPGIVAVLRVLRDHKSEECFPGKVLEISEAFRHDAAALSVALTAFFNPAAYARSIGQISGRKTNAESFSCCTLKASGWEVFPGVSQVEAAAAYSRPSGTPVTKGNRRARIKRILSVTLSNHKPPHSANIDERKAEKKQQGGASRPKVAMLCAIIIEPGSPRVTTSGWCCGLSSTCQIVVRQSEPQRGA
ncbi:hypothetical protein Bbelb_420090 [Branchiostoma belcheri]|nr:hypothetical protein Bbelb_420090 [Branchiostoma belcheri]